MKYTPRYSIHSQLLRIIYIYKVIAKPLQLYKKAYSGLSKESWYLSFVMLINRSGTMVVPFLTIYCTQKLNFSIVEAGLIMATFGLGSVFGAFFGGKFWNAQMVYSNSKFITYGFQRWILSTKLRGREWWRGSRERTYVRSAFWEAFCIGKDFAVACIPTICLVGRIW